MAHPIQVGPRAQTFAPKLPLFALLGLCALACAGPQASVARHLAQGKSALAAARAAHAADVPGAAVHVDLADKQLALAQNAAQDGEYERAHSLIACAQADANLALALAQEAPAQARAQELSDQATAGVDVIAGQADTGADHGSETDVYIEAPADDQLRSGWARQPDALDGPEPDAVGLPLDREP